MCLSCPVSDIFNVEYWRDLDIWVRGHSPCEFVPISKSLKSADTGYLSAADSVHGSVFIRF